MDTFLLCEHEFTRYCTVRVHVLLYLEYGKPHVCTDHGGDGMTGSIERVLITPPSVRGGCDTFFPFVLANTWN